MNEVRIAKGNLSDNPVNQDLRLNPGGVRGNSMNPDLLTVLGATIRNSRFATHFGSCWFRL